MPSSSHRQNHCYFSLLHNIPPISKPENGLWHMSSKSTNLLAHIPRAAYSAPMHLSAGALQMIIRRLSHGAEDVRLAALGLLAELAKLGLPITGV